MKENRRIWIALLILIPILVLGFLSVGPRPLKLVSTWQHARLAAAQDNYPEAAVLYRKLIEYQPERLDLWEKIGEFEYKAENYAAAVEAFEQAESAGAISNANLFDLGIAYQNIDEDQQALAAWRRLTYHSGLDSSEYAALVGALRAAGDLDGAVAAAREWVKARPQDVRSSYNLGLLISYVNPVEARDILLPVSAADTPESVNAQTLLQGLETAAGENPEEYGLVVIGQRLLQIEQFDLAEQAFTRAAGINPSYAEAWAMLSEARQLLGKDAWPDLEKAKSLNPTSDIVRAELALYYRRQSQPELALPVLRSLAADHPDEARWLLDIAAEVAAQGDLIEAMKTYQQATELEPKNPQTWRALASFAAENGFDSQSYSIPAAQKALELDPDDPQSLDLMGWIWLIEGDLNQAEQFLQQALGKDAANPKALLHLAQVYIEMNRMSLAYKPLRQAAEQSKDAAVAMQARRLLDKYFLVQP